MNEGGADIIREEGTGHSWTIREEGTGHSWI